MVRLLLFFAPLLCFSQAFEYEVKIVDPGTQTSDSRIVGGSDTNIQRFAHAVQVQSNGQLLCGGSLITLRHVLSAAHCFYDSNANLVSPSRISIRSGTSNLGNGGTTTRVSMIIVHESYNLVTQDADVAVLLLSSAVTPSASSAPAAIPTQGFTLPDNTSLIVVGWGTTIQGGSSPAPVLQEVRVYKVNRTECAQRYALLAAATGLPYQVTNNMVCAGLLDIGGADACQGDSGGPLMPAQNLGLVVGITSWGFGCGEPLFPGVSARVSNFTNWILSTVQRYNSAPSLSLANTVVLLSMLLASLTIFKDA